MGTSVVFLSGLTLSPELVKSSKIGWVVGKMVKAERELPARLHTTAKKLVSRWKKLVKS